MKLIEYSIIKLQYDSEGRLFMRSFKNVRTNSIKYYSRKEDEFFKNYNPKTDVIALWDMRSDKLYFYSSVINPSTKYFSFGYSLFPSFALRDTYSYSISPILKRYIKNEI